MEKETDNTRVLSLKESALVQSALASHQAMMIQNLPAIQKMIDVRMEILSTFDFSAIFRTVAEMQRGFVQIQKTMNLFATSRPFIISYPVEKPREVLVVHEISEHQEDRIADKVIAKLQSNATTKNNDVFLLDSSDRIVNIPERASWEALTLTFNSPEEITVHYKNDFIGRYSYEELGFHRKNTHLKRPNLAWGFFLILAISMRKNESTVERIFSGGYFEKETAIHTSRSALSKQLKKAFGISEDPFYSYKEEGQYKTKFKLIPMPDMRHNELFMQSGDKDLREEDYLNR